jgi:predicted DCC family thiol-disulfide oxidoreductase YuxK
MTKVSSSTPGPVQVYFDGGCPVCSREIAFYRAQVKGEGFDWIDAASASDASLGEDLPRSAALARMHVRLADGRLVSGAAAFAALWRGVPGLSWLGRLLQIPPIGACAEIAYRVFLKVRPMWRRA